MGREIKKELNIPPVAGDLKVLLEIISDISQQIQQQTEEPIADGTDNNLETEGQPVEPTSHP